MTKKKYLQTHPWLTFALDLRRLSPPFWFDLGECVGKFEDLLQTPMSDALWEKIKKVYLAKGAAASTAIEGNTLGEAGVLRRLEAARKPSLAREYREVEVDNVVALFNEFSQQARDNSLPPFTPQLLDKINGGVLRELNAEALAGKVRRRGVTVADQPGAPYQDCAYLLEKLCVWLREGKEFRRVESEQGRMAGGVLRAVLTHLYIAWIHPYDDGNGRTARMAEFFLLVAAGIPESAAHLISNHCNDRRADYYRQLSDSRKTQNPADFIGFIVRGLRDGLRAQMAHVLRENTQLVWHKFLDANVDGGKKTKQRRIALARFLAKEDAVLSVRQMLAQDAVVPWFTNRVAPTLTLQNDLESLIKNGLVAREENGYRARLEILRESPTAK